MALSKFKAIFARAAKRKGGEAALAGLLPAVKSARALARIGDDRYLSEMTRRIFCAGFVWRVIDTKWPGFEEGFLSFNPARLLFQPDEFWADLASNRAIVRNPQKINAVRANAQFVSDTAAEYGSFGKFLGTWPQDDQIGLMAFLSKRGTRLGGNTGQYFLRFVGRDSFILSRDVVACLKDAGLELADNPTTKRDLTKIQAAFNQWHEETGLPYTHLSRICSMSIGENIAPETLKKYQGGEQD